MDHFNNLYAQANKCKCVIVTENIKNEVGCRGQSV
jgi:hypothetical protein